MKLSQVTISAGVCTLLVGFLCSAATQSIGQPGNGLNVDLVRNRIVAQAILQYSADNDSRVPPAQYTGTYSVGGSRPDRVWPQLVLPYHGNMMNYREPEDPVTNAGLQADLPDCTGNPLQCEYNLGVKSHRGYNFEYLSPLGANCGSQGGALASRPILLASAANPGKTLMAIDSVWDRVGGLPVRGGSHQVDSPARFTTAGTDTLPPVPGCAGRWINAMWTPSLPSSWSVYGGAWTWHKGTHMVVSYLDGHIGIVSVPQLSAGATVLDAWGGRIFDRDAYLWDLQ